MRSVSKTTELKEYESVCDRLLPVGKASPLHLEHCEGCDKWDCREDSWGSAAGRRAGSATAARVALMPQAWIS